MSASANDLDLLRRLRAGAAASPAARCSCPPGIDGYLQRCSLWRSRGRRAHQQLAAVGEITTENIAELVPGASGANDYLRFVQEPMDFAGYRAWRQSTDRPSLLRHRPLGPGRRGLPAAGRRLRHQPVAARRGARRHRGRGRAAVLAMQAEQPGCTYYGRVVREGGYIACHYLFFYVMNDFRSTFFGVNDHEADWEQVIVYLTEPVPGSAGRADAELGGLCRARPVRGRPAPPVRRPAAAAGRRPHPVVHVGAGSHAGYFAPGEYVFSVRPKPVRRALRLVDTARQVWRESLRQGMSDPTDREWSEAFAVPFIDYARGDGQRIGPGTDALLGAGAAQRGRTVAGPLPRAVGAGHRRPVRRRAGPGRAQVQPRRLDPHLVVGRASASPGWTRWCPSRSCAAHLTARVARAAHRTGRRRRSTCDRLRDRLRGVELDHLAAREGRQRVSPRSARPRP